LSHDLGPKDFYPRREKCGLEGMTWTWTMTGASEGALPGVAGRIRNLIFHCEKWQAVLWLLCLLVFIPVAMNFCNQYRIQTPSR
jgi:hypothetical protein